MNIDHTDVVIFGAGLTGLIVATALAQRGIRTLLLDLPREGGGTHGAEAVPAATEAVLREQLAAVGGRVLWCRAVVGVTQNDNGVTATLEGGLRVNGRHLVLTEAVRTR